MKAYAQGRGDTKLVELCDKALSGIGWAIDECQNVFKDGCSLLPGEREKSQAESAKRFGES